MASQEFLKQIRSQFGRRYTVATQPDHPYLLTGPDALIGGNGVLVAVFTPKAAERRTPEELLIRLTASRLALPGHAHCILMVNRTTEGVVSSISDVAAFDYTIFLSASQREGWRDLERFVSAQGPSELPRGRRDLVEIQRRIFVRTNAFLEESQRNLNRYLERQTRSPREALIALEVREPYRPRPWTRREPELEVEQLPVLEDLSQQAMTTSSASLLSARESMVRSRESLVGAVSFASGRSPVVQLSRFFSAGFREEYVLDNGVPYPVEQVPKILFVNQSPILRLDPLKPTRAMAFSGWVMTQVGLSEEPNAITQDIATRVRGRY